MHPVARVLIKYWKNLRKQQSIFSAIFYCALLTLHVSAPFGDHLRVVHKRKNIQGSHYIFNGSVCLLNGSVEYIVTALDIFVFVNHLKMAAKRGRNM
jgi:hypothetical protein